MQCQCKEVTTYTSPDGRIFNTKEECIKYMETPKIHYIIGTRVQNTGNNNYTIEQRVIDAFMFYKDAEQNLNKFLNDEIKLPTSLRAKYSIKTILVNEIPLEVPEEPYSEQTIWANFIKKLGY